MSNSALNLLAHKFDGRSIRRENIYIEGGHGFKFADIIRYDENDGWTKAIANSAKTAEGVAVVEVIDDERFNAVYYGELNFPMEYSTESTSSWITNGNKTFEEASVYFLDSNTAGGLTQNPPSIAGRVIKPMIVTTEMNDASKIAIVTNYVGSVIGTESTVSLDSVQPVGAIFPFGGDIDDVPSSFLACNGHAHKINDYNLLFARIGHSFKTVFHFSALADGNTKIWLRAGVDTESHLGLDVGDTLNVTVPKCLNNTNGSVTHPETTYKLQITKLVYLDKDIAKSTRERVIEVDASEVFDGQSFNQRIVDTSCYNSSTILKVSNATDSTSFFVPSLRGKTVIGEKESKLFGSTLPGAKGQIGGFEVITVPGPFGSSHPQHLEGLLSPVSAGGYDQSFDFLPPYCVTNWIIQAKAAGAAAIIEGSIGATSTNTRARKNEIINPEFEIWERPSVYYTTGTNEKFFRQEIPNSDPYSGGGDIGKKILRASKFRKASGESGPTHHEEFGPDRWKLIQHLPTNVAGRTEDEFTEVTLQQDPIAASSNVVGSIAPKYSLKFGMMGRHINGSSGEIADGVSGGYQCVEQRIEDVRKFSGQSMAISFHGKLSYVAAGVDDEIAVRVTQVYKDSNNITVHEQHQYDIVELGADWGEYVSIIETMPIPSLMSDIDFDKSYTAIAFHSYLEKNTLNNFTNFHIGKENAHTLYLANVKVEVGSVATEYEPASRDSELSKCRKYYRKSFAYGKNYQDYNTKGLYLDAVPADGNLPDWKAQSSADYTLKEAEGYQFQEITKLNSYFTINHEDMRDNPSVRIYSSTGTPGRARLSLNNIPTEYTIPTEVLNVCTHSFQIHLTSVQQGTDIGTNSTDAWQDDFRRNTGNDSTDKDLTNANTYEVFSPSQLYLQDLGPKGLQEILGGIKTDNIDSDLARQIETGDIFNDDTNADLQDNLNIGIKFHYTLECEL